MHKHLWSRVSGGLLSIVGCLAVFAVGLGHTGELGGISFVLLYAIAAAIPFGLYGYTLWRTSSLVSLYIILGAVIVSTIIPLLNLRVSGEAFGGFVVAIVMNWVICSATYFMVLGFGERAPNRAIEGDARKDGARPSP